MNIIYNDFNTALADIAWELSRPGNEVPVYNAVGDTVMTKEIMDASVTFAPEYGNICTLPSRKFPLKGAQAEFLWYMTGIPDAHVVAKYLPNWLNYAGINGKVNSNYGSYWYRSIPRIIDILECNKTSRQAVMNIYNSSDAPFGKDTPCTLSLQFLIRKDEKDIDRLNLICNMRSNDLWYGLCIDQFCNSLLMQLVRNSLLSTYPDLQLGTYTHHAGSLHVYTTASKGNAVIAPETLRELSEENVICQPDIFTIGEEVTFTEFWDTARVYFDTAQFDYFKDCFIRCME